MQFIIKRLLLLIFIFIVISFSFCNRTSKEADKKVSYWIGKTLNLPEISEILYNDSLYYENNQIINNEAKIKIVTSLNGKCSSCIKDLRKWQKLFQSININNEVEILYYLLVPNLEYFRGVLYSKDIYKFPLIIDDKFKYIDTNNISLNDPMFQTFLLDYNNRIILVGNPIYNKKLMKLYKDEINNRLN